LRHNLQRKLWRKLFCNNKDAWLWQAKLSNKEKQKNRKKVYSKVCTKSHNPNFVEFTKNIVFITSLLTNKTQECYHVNAKYLQCKL